MEEEQSEQFKDGSDLCKQLMDHYANSAAPHHRHLLATAAALRSNLISESLPLTPTSYFAASISAAAESEAMDTVALSALASFMAITLPLVPSDAIPTAKARKAAEVLVEVLARQGEGEGLGVSGVRAAMKSLGVLTGFCDLEDWDSIKLGFRTLLLFSIDKRPKVRRCAKESLQKIFGSLKSSTVIKEASKLVLSELKRCIASAMKLIASRTDNECKGDEISKHEQLEVLHMLNVVNLTAAYLSAKAIPKVLLEVHKLLDSQFLAFSSYTLKTIEAIFEASKVQNIVLETEDIVVSLASLVSLGERNPLECVILAATLLRLAMDLLYTNQSSLWIKNLPLVCRSMMGLLNFEGNTASQASSILKDVLKHHVGPQSLLIGTDQTIDDSSQESVEGDAIKSTCEIFENALSADDGIPNEHILSVLSVLFLELGQFSFVFMRNIVLKLADSVIHSSGGKISNEHLQKCIGSAVYAMGPDRFLTLVPITFNENSYAYSNFWLVPIFKRYIFGASLAYYMEHIMPLAKSFKKASRKVKKNPGTSQDLLARAYELWGLLPSFCHHATDTYQSFTRLSDVLVTFLKKDPSMHENVSKALQILVNENKAALSPRKNELDFSAEHESSLELGMQPAYSKKAAARNLKSLTSCSNGLLYILSDIFISSLPQMRISLKGAIRCLASITDSSVTKDVLMSLFKRLQFVDHEEEAETLISNSCVLDSEPSGVKEYDQRCLILEIASCLVEGANDNLIEIIYNLTIQSFQATNESVQHEAYNTLSKILEEHPCFSTPRYMELIDLLHGLKPPTDVSTLRSRFACFHKLMVQTVKISLEEEENSKAFLILNEIILTLKDGKDEARKEAHDLLLNMSSSLRDLTLAGPNEPYHKLVSMIMGYLSGSSPHVKSGAVSVLSVLVYKDANLCFSFSGLVPSLLSLLHSKDLEITKAVLGFVKVMVSCLHAKELQTILSDVVTEILPWSSVSRNHLKSKVTVIFEILLRKCGSASVKLVTPEKYKDFLKEVLENRHGKSSAAVTNDTEINTKDSSAKGPEEKPNESGTRDLVKHTKRKREDKFKTDFPSKIESQKSSSNGEFRLAKRSKHSNDKNFKARSEGIEKNNKGRHKSFPGGGGKRKLNLSSLKKDKAASRVGIQASKSHKLERKLKGNS